VERWGSRKGEMGMRKRGKGREWRYIGSVWGDAVERGVGREWVYR
jgi:hypothetical protein